MNVPLLDVNAQNRPLAAELRAAFDRVLDSGRFIMGPEIEALERDVAKLSSCAHGIGVSSGTDALLLALMALEIGPGDEVLCPAFTFFATAGCISRVGATPVMVDVCPVCFNIDPAKCEEKITSRTRAVIPVHLFGQTADMGRLMDLAAARELRVIEDAAQSMGASCDAKPSGSIGDCGAFSFFPSKNLGGFGDGGMLVTNDADFAETARVLRLHGSKPKYYHHRIGGNFRLDALQAALLQVKLARYPDYVAARRQNAAYYTEKLSAIPGIAQGNGSHRCGPVPDPDGAVIILPAETPGRTHIWNQFTLRVVGDGRRDALRSHLDSAGIGSEIYYPLTMDQQKCFQNLPDRALSGIEVGRRLAGEALSIPIYPELTREMQDHVIDAISRFLQN